MTTKINILKLFFIAAMSLGVLNCAETPKIVPLANALIVDVRTAKEYNKEHYPGAVNIPYDEVENRLDEFGEKDKEIVLYCRSGRRSSIALEVLKKSGFVNVKDVKTLKKMKALKK